MVLPMQKAGVEERPLVFPHAGLLDSGPSKSIGLPHIQSTEVVGISLTTE